MKRYVQKLRQEGVFFFFFFFPPGKTLVVKDNDIDWFLILSSVPALTFLA